MTEHRSTDPAYEVCIVLPAFNEGKSLTSLLDRTAAAMENARLSYQVIVVDDGSADTTAQLAESLASRMPVMVLRHHMNLGYGAALRTGLLAATDRAPVVVTMDADDTHDPGLIEPMLEKLRAGCDLVVASRRQAGAEEVGVPLHRRLLSRAAGLILGTAVPISGLKDYTSGYRAYRSSLLQDLIAERGQRHFITEDGFVAGAEVLLRAGLAGARIEEVPLVLRYDRKRARSAMRIIPTVMDYFRVLLVGVRRTSPGGRRHSRRGSVPAAGTAAADVLGIMGGFAVSYLLFALSVRRGWIPGPIPPATEHLGFAAAFALFSLAVLWRRQLYRGRATVLGLGLLQATARSLGLSAAVFLAVTLMLQSAGTRSNLLGVSVVLSIPLVLLARRVAWSRLKKRALRSGRGRRALICGYGETGRLLAKKINQAPSMGVRVMGFVDDLSPIGRTSRYRVTQTEDRHLEVPVLGRFRDLETVVARYRIDEILVTFATGRGKRAHDVVSLSERLNVDVGFVPDLASLRTDQLIAEDVSAMPILRPVQASTDALDGAVKRLLDAVFSGVLALLTLPVWLLAAVLIRLDTPGPVIFRQVRVGQGGKPFRIFKFRTMYADVPSYEKSPSDDRDPRLTRVGRVLRLSGLDELPQLLNVLRGEMSLVGPRPEMPFVVDTYSSIERQRLDSKPGMTGLWQLSPDRAEAIHDNLEYDLYYQRNRSLTLDLLILGETAIFAMHAFTHTLLRLVGVIRPARRAGSGSRSDGAVAAEALAAPEASGASYVFVALDQRSRPEEPESWRQYVPAALTLCEQWPVKLLVAAGNGMRFDEILTDSLEAAANGNGTVPEYVEYADQVDLLTAAAAASLVVTDLPHVADTARETGIDVLQLGGSESRFESGSGRVSREMLETLQQVFRLDTGVAHIN